MLRTLFNRISALLALIFLSPLLLLIAVFIVLDSSGGVFFLQERIGKDGVPFKLYKFRTMKPESEAAGKLTVGHHDPRITEMGVHLRKYKLDELPQLINVLNGTMNLVGPRPEVADYVAHYTQQQLKVLRVKPGITDYASLRYFDENEILQASADPGKTYLDEIMPAKLEMNLEYIEHRTFMEDLKIIWLTIKKILG